MLAVSGIKFQSTPAITNYNSNTGIKLHSQPSCDTVSFGSLPQIKPLVANSEEVRIFNKYKHILAKYQEVVCSDIDAIFNTPVEISGKNSSKIEEIIGNDIANSSTESNLHYTYKEGNELVHRRFGFNLISKGIFRPKKQGIDIYTNDSLSPSSDVIPIRRSVFTINIAKKGESQLIQPKLIHSVIYEDGHEIECERFPQRDGKPLTKYFINGKEISEEAL